LRRCHCAQNVSLETHVAHRKNLLKREIQKPWVRLLDEHGSPARLILFGEIPKHVKILAILCSPHVRIYRTIRRNSEYIGHRSLDFLVLSELCRLRRQHSGSNHHSALVVERLDLRGGGGGQHAASR